MTPLLLLDPTPVSILLAYFLQLPSIKEIIDGFREIIKLVWGEHAPAWLLPFLGYVLLFALVLTGLWGLLSVLGKIKDLFLGKFVPIFYNRDERRKSARRRRFADHVESEIRRLNNLESWNDYRFAELEADVDAEGRRQGFRFRDVLRTRNTLRRERSLSVAIKNSKERLIILEGDPGSGKSVALRYVVQRMATRAMRSRSNSSIIPIYVNLKEMGRPEGTAIDRNLIFDFVLKSLNRVQDRDIDEFLQKEFDRGLEDGTWFFLFDSFDELPEILSSTEADEQIKAYAGAISDFLHGMNRCRGIIASRQFRGPKQFGWSRFVIRPLTSKRRQELIHKVGLEPAMERGISDQLETAGHEIRSMAQNPMFLGLLCNHIRDGNSFPDTTHTVYETYIDTRLNRDRDRVSTRFNLEPSDLRRAAENIAFSMSADRNIGLSPTRASLKEATTRLGMSLDERFSETMDALEYIKLARSETAATVGASHQFTFAHRRFQEYFATCVVMREPSRISADKLLLDARWRETAVVMCQTQPLEVLVPLLNSAESIVSQLSAEVEKAYGDSFQIRSVAAEYEESSENDFEAPPGQFEWPMKAIHVLGLLQEGFARRPGALIDAVKEHAATIVLYASRIGTLLDRKIALEVSGILPARMLILLLRRTFAGTSLWLYETAYRQAARLSEVPIDIALSIRQTLIRMTITRRLKKEKMAVRAHLSRLDKSVHFLSSLRLLLWIPLLDFVLYLGLVLYLLSRLGSRDMLVFWIMAIVLTFVFASVWSTLYLLSLVSHRSTRRLGFQFWMNVYFVRLSLSISLFIPIFLLRISLGGMSLILYTFLAELWSLSAFIAVLTGEYTEIYWWPILPLTTIFQFFGNINKLWLVLRRITLRRWVSGILVVFLVASFFILAFAYRRNIGFVIDKYFEIFLFPVGFVSFIGMLFGVYLMVTELSMLSRANKGTDKITGEDFIKTLSRFRIPFIRLLYIRRVRSNQLLNNEIRTDSYIRRFALAFEERIRRTKNVRNSDEVPKSLGNTNTASALSLDDEMDSYETTLFKNLTPIGASDMLDEIYKIVEQIDAAR